MDRQPVGDRAMLSRAARSVWILSYVRVVCGFAGRRECLMCRHDSLVELGSLLDVRLDVELAPRTEQPRYLGEKDVAHDEALRMALLPPRIREVEKDACDHAVGTEAGQRLSRVLAEDASSSGVSLLRETSIADRRPLLADLEADEPVVRGRHGALAEKAGLRTRTDLELQLDAGDDAAEIDVIALRKTRCILVRAGLSG
jgi:hypothetical protein